MKRSFILLFTILSCAFCNAQSTTDNSKTDAAADTLYVSLNDKLFFEVEVDSANHLSFRKTGNIANSSKTISIELTYSQGMGTLLKIQNPFSKALSYKAELYAYKRKDYVETSTIPVQPNLGSFETWPFKIDKMRLTGFVLTAAD